MQPFCRFAFLLIFPVFVSSKSYTADVHPSLERHRRDADTTTVLTPLRLEITSKVSSRFENTIVSSKLENKLNKNQEAKFAVQLPETAFISNFSMVVDGKQYIGKVKEKDAAKSEYEEAKNESRNTGLVSSSGSKSNVRGMDLFDIAINVAPNSSAEFKLTYQQLLKRTNGFYEYTISVRPKQIVPYLKVVIDIVEPQDLSFVDVMKLRPDPSDPVVKGNPLAKITNTSPTSVHIEFNPSEEEQKKQGPAGVHGDFITRYDVAHGNDAGIIQVLGSYFVQYFSPSGLLLPLAKNIVFVIDISGSMSGQKIVQTRDAMFAILSQLRGSDSFNIVIFNSAATKWRVSASLATNENIQAGKVFVRERVKAGGSTNIDDALRLALKLLKETAKQKISPIARNFPVVMFLTDGNPTAGTTNTKTIRTNVQSENDIKASIFALGFGFNLNFDFLTALSVENGGMSRRIYPDKDAASQLEGFYNEISTPLMLRVRFEYPKDIVDVTKVTASEFPQYYKGSELVVCGKIKEGGNSRQMAVKVRGVSSNNTDMSFTMSQALNKLTVPPDKVLNEDFIERLWAYMTIKQLLVKLLITDDSTEQARLKAEALQMSLQYNFVTPLTSFVVVQKDSYSKNDGRERGINVRNKYPASNDRSACRGLTPSSAWKVMSFLLLIPLY